MAVGVWEQQGGGARNQNEKQVQNTIFNIFNSIQGFIGPAMRHVLGEDFIFEI